jgi:hypothetical protein
MKLQLPPKNTTLSRSDSFALSFFLSLTLDNVLQHLEAMQPTEKAIAIEQIVSAASMIFPNAFEA